MEVPDLKDKEGNQVELIYEKKVKGLKRGSKPLLDTLSMYANSQGQWFYEKADIDKLI
jgi:hypothetical protein